MNFNAINLANYGLVVTHSNIPDSRQQYESQLIQDISYGFKPKKPPKIIRLEVSVIATSRAILDGYLDSIKSAITTEEAKVFKLDTVTDRYWTAKQTDFEGKYRAAGLWEGTIIFQADDPMAYDNTETSSDHNIDADPKTVTETPGGTGYINPVYTLTAGEDLTDVTIKLENLTTEEEIQWTGSLANTEELEIDVATWIVKKEGTADMSSVTGKFPRLAPNMLNSIKVTAFSTTGSLNITYRERFL